MRMVKGAAILFAAALLLSLPLGAWALNINEIRIDQPGGDVDEYFELAGDALQALDGYTYLVIGDGATGCGTIEAVVDLTGQVIPASGYFVAAEGTFTLGTADMTTTLNFENSDNVTHMLVTGFTGMNGDDLDTDDDGVLDVMPWASIVDWVSLVENPAIDCVNFVDAYYSPITVGPDGPYVPGHVYWCPPGTTGNGWQIGQFDPVGGQDTPGAVNSCPTPARSTTWGRLKALW